MKKNLCFALCVAVMMFSVVACTKKKKDATSPAIDCSASGLSVTAVVSNNTATANASGGTNPYQYSVDGTTYQTSNSLTLTNGNNTVYAKDANGCTATTTAVSNAVMDSRDNHVYKTVTIGTQTWMAENLNYAPTSGIGSCYNGVSDSCTKYGKLYDTTSMKTNPCMAGWHVPTKNEWQTLLTYLAITNSANVDKLEAGTTNSVGFNSLMAGGYDGSHGYTGVGTGVAYWTTTTYGINAFYAADISTISSGVYMGTSPNGSTPNIRLCIRCLKND